MSLGLNCRICADSGPHPKFRVKEMMYGTREEFDYFECAGCGCLQIAEIPADLSRHYPRDYYSLAERRVVASSKWRSAIRKKRVRAFTHYGIDLEALWLRLRGRREFLPWLKKAKLDFTSHILDVGSGSGSLLLDLQRYGFQNLTGVEPHIEKDLQYGPGLRILKTSVHRMGLENAPAFDFIMAHHSFEHMPDPLEVLRSFYRLLKPGRFALLRIPTVSSWVWGEYRTDWVQLDAPRHLFLYSIESIRMLAEKAGFVLDEVVYDSSEFQFWGSEQYRRGIPLNAPESFSVNREASLFTPKEIREFKRRASLLNREKRGDSVCLYLRKK